MHFAVRLRGRQHDHTAGVAHEDRRFGPIVMGLEFFDRDRFRMERRNHVRDTVVNLFHPRLK